MFVPAAAQAEVIVPLRKVAQGSSKMLTGTAAEKAAVLSARRITVSPNVVTAGAHPSGLQNQLTRATKYQRERVQATVARFQLNEAQRVYQSMADFSSQTPNWKAFVVNRSLNKYLDQAVLAQDYEQALTELTDYYSLNEGHFYSILQMPENLFVSSAISYLMRHPHKVNLSLRETLKSTYVDTELKNQINVFVRKEQLTVEDQENLATLLRQAHEQYRIELMRSLQSPQVINITRAYRQVSDAVEDFIAQTNRFPQIAAGPNERALAIQVNLLLEQSHLHMYEPVKEQMQRLQQLREDFPMEILTPEAFKEQYRAFVNHTGQINPLPPNVVSDSEAVDYTLYNSYEYYRTREPATFKQIVHPIIRNFFPPGALK